MLHQKPRICTFNVQEKIVDHLKNRYEDVFEGSLDTAYQMPFDSRNPEIIVSNYRFPSNIHEYDVFILDLQTIEVQRFYHEINDGRLNTYHATKFLIGKTEGSYLDVRVEGLYHFDEKIREIYKPVLIVIFNGPFNEYSYNVNQASNVKKFNTLPFLDLSSVRKYSRSGKEIIPSIERTPLNLFINKFIKEIKFLSCFDIPYIVHRTGNFHSTTEPNPEYDVLLKNSNEQMISFKTTCGNRTFLVLPYIENKEDFLLKFLDNVAIETFPDFFLESNTKKWIHMPPYLSPNEEQLIKERDNLKNKYAKEDKEIEGKIIADRTLNSCFYDILTETGDSLVDAVAKVLEGFSLSNIQVADKMPSKKLREEDLFITLADGSIILMEVKGIYGTSSDDDCSQIYKVVNRRKDALQRFDIRGIYLVNHQRSTAPLKRKNPPFSNEQISDSITDQRGLLTTWELFKAWNMFQIKILSLKHFISSFRKSGLIKFDPDLIEKIGEVKKIYPKKHASVVDVSGCTKTGDEIFFLRDEIYRPTIVQSIQINGAHVNSAADCEMGIVTTEKLEEGMKLFRRKEA